MRFTSLSFRHFRGFDDFWLRPLSINVITGPNGCGKSTLMHGLEYVLSGKCALTNEAGRGGELAMRGHLGGSVSLACGDEVATRDTDGKLSVNWARGGQGDSQRELEKVAGCKADQARLCLRSGRFFDLDGKAQSSLLSELLQTHVGPKHVAAELTLIQDSTNLPILDVCKAVVGSTVNDLGRAHKLCKEERTVVNRIVKELEADLARMEAEAASLVFVDLEERQSRQDRVNLAKRALESAISKAGAAEREQAHLAHTKANLEAERRELTRLEGELGDVPDLAEAQQFRAKVSNALHDRRVSLGTVKANLREVRAQLDAHNLHERELASARSLLAELEASVTTGCQWAPDVTCPGADLRNAKTQERITSQRAVVAELASKLDSADPVSLDERIAKLTEEVADFEKRISIGEERLREADAKVNAAASAAHKRAAFEAKAESIAALAASVEALEAQPDSQADLAAEVPRCRAALGEAEEALLEAEAWKRHRTAADAVKDKLAEAKTRQACLEHLVPLFAPDGLAAKVLSRGLSPFQTTLNDILRRWGMEARHDANLALEVARGGGFVPFKSLSDGEQILVSLAHQVAFAALTGLGIVVVDRIEALDDEHQRALLEACVELTQGPTPPDHILLMGVRCVPVPEGVLHVQLERQAQAVAA